MRLKLLLLLLLPMALSAPASAQEVCTNPRLLEFFKVIGSACKDHSCDVSVMAEIDQRIERKDLLGALRNASLSAVHLFYPSGRHSLVEAFDWSTIKREQIDSIDAALSFPHENAIVYVIGKASVTGDPELNIRLSRDRARGVVKYMQENVSNRFHHYHTAWAGAESLQMNVSDARLLNLEPQDYRNDPLILNQSVHVFIYPCVDVLEYHAHSDD